MSYDGLTFAELSARFSSLRQAPLGDRRAPHKPLLILLMFGRYQRRNFRSLLFEEAQVQLKELLFEFGPPSRSINVLDPFWRLQNDGIWKVEDALGARVAETVAPPMASTLVDCTARGNFAPDIGAALQKQPAYIPRLARELLTAHFPQSLHADICAAVGLELNNVPDELATEQRLARDAEFRPRIIRAYEYRCAVTGWDLRVGHIEVGLEAAHIKWHSAGGPSVESNGIALNSLHHKLFDLGAFTLSLGDTPPQILVSREVHGGDYARQLLIDLHHKPIRQPQDPAWLPDAGFVKWHHEEVFKGPARA
jgi:putative restriction endonuclease